MDSRFLSFLVCASPDLLNMNNTLKEYHFTDEQIVFLMQIVRDNAQYEDTEDREWMEDFADQIEDQIVNHPTNS